MLYTLITGATNGIGLEFATVAAKHGRNIIIVGRDDTKLASVKANLAVKFPKISVLIINQDLSLSDSAKNIFKYTEEEKLEIECLINNAGFGDYGPFVTSDLTKQMDMIRVNIGVVTELTHYYLPAMVKNGKGQILNVASVAAFLPGPTMSVYYASKAYVLGFSQALAEELSGTGVTVTALCPGPTASNFAVTAGNTRHDFLSRIRRLPTSSEVAEYGYKAMEKKQRVAIHGFSNILTAIGLRFIPTWLVTKAVYHFQRSVH